jgi:hypothetical protein
LSMSRVYPRRAWQRCFLPVGVSSTRPTASTQRRRF